jgi:hypothetical protein
MEKTPADYASLIRARLADFRVDQHRNGSLRDLSVTENACQPSTSFFNSMLNFLQ